MSRSLKGQRILVANRGEIAVRIMRTASDMGLTTCAVFPADDANAMHVRTADTAAQLPGRGAAAYLDVEAVIAAAKTQSCDMLHPGYGFLSESAALAAACAAAGIAFIGPDADTLRQLGDKAAARTLALRCDVPVVEGTAAAVSDAQALAFAASVPADVALMVKAVQGGGGRGIRTVLDRADLPRAIAECRAEALGAFGDDAIYIEQKIEAARHVEVQVLGDGSGDVVHLWERECTLQRRHQKLIEIAPSPWLTEAQRTMMLEAACRLAKAVAYRGLVTIEFLVDTARDDIRFIEANPRIQVEHTVTEQITGIDLVAAQIRVCLGESLRDLDLTQTQIARPHGYAVQARVNAEIMNETGAPRMASGQITLFEAPGGPGVRVDGAGFAGLSMSPHYDTLLAKVIVHRGSNWEDVRAALGRALKEFRIAGVQTNIGFLRALLERPEVMRGEVTTQFVDQNIAALVAVDASAQTDTALPTETAENATQSIPIAASEIAITAPMSGVLARLLVAEGASVAEGAPVAILEAMKMEHEVLATQSGIVRALAETGEIVAEGAALVVLEPAEVEGQAAGQETAFDPDHIRSDLAEVLSRRDETLDAARAEAVARRHAKGKRTARENLDDLCDADSFVEYGALAVAAQRSRHSEEHLRKISPADGLIAGLGTINADLFGAEHTRVAVMSYDYTVMAGTQGGMGHHKTDRLLSVAEQGRLPVVVYAEGGGGRPGDTDNKRGANLAIPTFWQMAKLSGRAPMVGVVSGRCFAGNAAVLGVCDVVIATRDANIGMGGPAMIEGAGLGVFRPEEVGPVSVQSSNGVIDVLVEDEAEATATAKKYLSYFQGYTKNWEAPDQRNLRGAIPENRMRAYDVRTLIETLADVDSVLELRREFGPAMVTALVRLEGKPCGIMANVSAMNGGAIDRDEADKAARFMQLCDAYNLPIVSFVDTPGFMVGPEAEERANVRHFSRMFLVGASLQTAFLSCVVRKAYGLGAMAMTGGSMHHGSQMTLSWPSGEFGDMGFEGAARLGYRKELEAIEDADAREVRFHEIVEQMYVAGRATNIAPYLSIDAVIDPAETRAHLVSGLVSFAKEMRGPPRRSMIDAW